MKKCTPAVSVLDNNKVRFNKNFDKSSLNGSTIVNSQNQAFVLNTGNKKISVRNYKVGELPDIQIATKDLMDPLLFLTSSDH